MDEVIAPIKGSVFDIWENKREKHLSETFKENRSLKTKVKHFLLHESKHKEDGAILDHSDFIADVIVEFIKMHSYQTSDSTTIEQPSQQP